MFTIVPQILTMKKESMFLIHKPKRAEFGIKMKSY
jgi:hypothetical protein